MEGPWAWSDLAPEVGLRLNVLLSPRGRRATGHRGSSSVSASATAGSSSLGRTPSLFLSLRL